jgi:GntR family transcriptional regulator / MocR family aminotransferase
MKISNRPVPDRALRSPRSPRSWEVTLSPQLSTSKSARSPLYVQIVQAIVTDIRRGRLLPGQALPGSRTLAERLGVHRNTVLTAYAELQAEGWIQTDRARSTRVCEQLPELAAPAAQRSRRSSTLGFALPGLAPLAPPSVDEGLLLSDGTPDLRLAPRVALARAYRRVLRGRDSELLGYGDVRGHVRLRHALAAMLRSTRGLEVSEHDLLLTRGSQMALSLLGRVLCGPGDVVAVEALGYRPAWQALGAEGARLVPVPVDEEGLCVEPLAELAQRERLRAVYVTPHHQYPTMVTLSASRRLALLELARRAGFAIIEDDYDHEFHYQGRPVLPLASADTAGVVVYVGTLSKILAPGLRLGYLVAPAALLERCASERLQRDRQGDLALECAVAELLEDGELQRHVGRMRRIYRTRRDALLAALERHLPGVVQARPPPGGMALWARVDGVDLDAWIARAAEQGLVLLGARYFRFDAAPAPYVRFGFARRSAEETARAIEQLARLLPKRVAARRYRA